ncbi:zf-HC2 domain-containing protein [Bacillota bacterium LX-D]|nr:zf-HC2 domain-containing protein [Bacillota bacterium LX-D]
MRCPEIRESIFAYLDDLLSAEQKKVFLAHLENCPACRQEVDLAQQTNKLLENFCTEVEPPADFALKVMDKINTYEAELKKVTSMETVKAKKEQAAAATAGLNNAQVKKRLFASRFARAASFAALIGTTGTLLIFNAVAKSPKIPLNSLTAKNPPVVAHYTAGESGQVVKDKQDKAGTEVKDKTGIEKTAEDSLNIETTASQEKTIVPQLAENGDQGFTGKNTGAGENKSKNNGSDTENLADNKVQDDDSTPPTRLEGPIKMASVAAGIPSKSIILKPIAVDDGYSNVRPQWTASGKKITYFSTKEATAGHYTLWGKNLADDSSSVIASNITDVLPLIKVNSVSPNGKRTLSFSGGQLLNTSLDGSEKIAVTPVLEAENISYAWSPNGKTIAINVKSKRSDERGLWLAQPDGSCWKLGTSIGGGNAVSWSPDGEKIAFTDGQNTIYVLLLGKAQPSLLLVVPEGDKLGLMSLEWSADSHGLLLDWAKPGSSQRGIYLATIPE